MIRRILVLFAAALIVCVSSAGATDVSSLTIKLNARHGSGENGTAVLTQQADGLHVVLNMANAPDGIEQPAHIHQGSCDILNRAPQWPLKAAIDVHKGADDTPAFVSCGEIK